MVTSFDRWEKDPFFAAAEEVQESADRMESTYRTWIHMKKDTSSTWNYEQLRRDMQAVLGTTKWQLDEFAKAVRSSYSDRLVNESRVRHREFIVAIEGQISKVEKSLEEPDVSGGKSSMSWVRLDEGECDELALFLSGPSPLSEKLCENIDLKDKELARETVKGPSEAKQEKVQGHRRTASASADIGAWKIAICDDAGLPNASNGQPIRPLQKIPSVSGFLNSMESVTKFKWPKNGIRKWKVTDRQQDSDLALLPPQPTRAISACYEKSKSCLDCGDSCDKQLNSWYGALQRQLQRSQYQMQYNRPIKVAVWILLLLGLIVLVVIRSI